MTTEPTPALPLVLTARRDVARPPRHLADLDRAERAGVVESAGIAGYRARQLAHHYFTRLTDDPAEMTDLPVTERTELVRLLLPSLLSEVRTQTADRGTTRKTLWRLFDGALVEPCSCGTRTG